MFCYATFKVFVLLVENYYRQVVFDIVRFFYYILYCWNLGLWGHVCTWFVEAPLAVLIFVEFGLELAFADVGDVLVGLVCTFVLHPSIVSLAFDCLRAGAPSLSLAAIPTSCDLGVPRP